MAQMCHIPHVPAWNENKPIKSIAPFGAAGVYSIHAAGAAQTNPLPFASIGSGWG